MTLAENEWGWGIGRLLFSLFLLAVLPSFPTPDPWWEETTWSWNYIFFFFFFLIPWCSYPCNHLTYFRNKAQCPWKCSLLVSCLFLFSTENNICKSTVLLIISALKGVSSLLSNIIYTLGFYMTVWLCCGNFSNFLCSTSNWLGGGVVSFTLKNMFQI